VVVQRLVRQGRSAFGWVTGVVVSLVAGCMLLNVLKDVVDRQRPGAEFLGSVGQSFPSGHVANTLLLGAAVLALWPRRARPVAVATVAVIVALVAAARVYEGRHWASDVVCTVTLALAYALPAFFHPDFRWRATVTAGAMVATVLLLVSARRGLHVPLPA